MAERTDPGELGVPLPDVRRFELWADLVLAHTATMSVLEHDLRAAHDMTFAQYDVLYNLWCAPDRSMTVTRLGRAVLYGSGSITNLVASVERRGWVRRERSSTDRRRVHVQLSEPGEEVFRQATSVVLSLVSREFVPAVPDADLPVLHGFAARLRARDDRGRRPPYPLPVQLPESGPVPPDRPGPAPDDGPRGAAWPGRPR